MSNQQHTEDGKADVADPVAQAEQLLKQKQVPQATALLERAERDDPRSRKLLYLLSVCYRVQRRFDDALKALERLRAEAPDYARAWQEIGHNHRDLGRFDAAIDAYEHAVELNPGLVASWRFLAEAHRKAGSAERAKLAEANFKRLSGLPPELVAVTSMMHEGKLYKAEKICRHFLKQTPHHPEAMRLLPRSAAG